MFCANCKKEIPTEAKFCGGCGNEVNTNGNSLKESDNLSPVDSGNDIIKCGNCNYIGHGEDARSSMAVVLAWLCIFIAWPITVIYFLTTSKYRCPKCQSVFLGIKNKDGLFVGQKGNSKSPILIIIYVLIGIAVIGILSSVVLASLNTAREKAQQAMERGI